MKVAVLALMALWIAVVSELPAQTVTEYSRHTPGGYRYSNERFGNYPGSYFTPRIEWARPFVAGPLNLLVFMPTAAARESVELASRLDARVDIVASAGNGGFYTWAHWARGEGGFYSDIPSPQALDERARILLSPAYRHHAIIIGRLMWTIIPEEFRAAILAKVKGGAALVFVTPWAIEESLLESVHMTADTPLAGTVRATVPLSVLPLDVTLDLPAGSRGKVKRMGPFEIKAGRLGEGRVVFLQYNDFHHYRVLQAGEEPTTGRGPGRKTGGPRPLRLYNNGREENALTPLAEFVGDDALHYEYYYSILAKALLYATGRQAGVSVRPDAVALSVKREELPSAPVTFRVGNANRTLSGTRLYYEIRDRRNHVVAKGEKAAAPEGDDLVCAPPFPKLPRGLYIADVWLKRRGAVLDWASAAVTVTNTPYLQSLTADKAYFRRDEAISGRIALATPLRENCRVLVELWDTHGRLEQRLELSHEQTAFQFEPIAHPLSRAYRIVCEVQDAGGIVDREETWMGLPSNDFDEFQFVAWCAAYGGRSARLRMHLLKEYGLTGYFDMAQYLPRKKLMRSADMLVRNNLTAWPLCYGIWSWSPKRYGDLRGGDWKERFRQVYLDRTDAYKRYGTLAYGIDSESEVDANEAAWDVPVGRRDYRRYLKERYREIETLNGIWGTTFAAFDDIGFISFTEAKANRQPARWLDQSRYKRDRFNEAAEYSAALVRERDPGARVSHDIACAPAKASFDIPRMARTIDAFIQSDLEHFDKRNQDRLGSGYWFGFYRGQMSEWEMRTSPWQSLFQGGKAIAWWPGNNTFTKDLCEPYLGFKQASEEIADIHRGIDRLLMSSRKRVDPILILWSYNSRLAGIYHPLETTWFNAVDSFTNMLRRTALDYECIGEEEVANRLQFEGRHRVLILPASQSISRQAVEKIKAFAAAGGLVIADYRPATLDEHLRPYGDAPVATDKKVEFQTCPKCKGKKIIHLGGAGDPLGNCPLCGGTGVVAKDDASALEKSALDQVFDFSRKGVRPYGKGYGIFLDGAPPRDEWRAIRGLLTEKGGVQGDIEVLDTLGNTRTDLRTYVFDNGPAMLVGVLPDKTVADPPGEDFILKTAKRMHVYNVRLHSYLGFSDAVPAGILPAQAKLFALLPARIDGVAATCDEREYRPGEVVTVSIRVSPAAVKDVALAVRIEVSHDGAAIPAHTEKLAVKGAAAHHIPLALNREPGDYAVRLTEVISGQREELRIKVAGGL